VIAAKIFAYCANAQGSTRILLDYDRTAEAGALPNLFAHASNAVPFPEQLREIFPLSIENRELN